MRKMIDMKGQRFGNLVVVEKVANPSFRQKGNVRHVWLCKCDCGSEKLTGGGSLRGGRLTSCGGEAHRGLDLTGQTFGLLTVIERDGSIGENAAWRCRCACDPSGGRIVTVESRYLRGGYTPSCGCKSFTKLIDLTGQTFGRLTVLRRADSAPEHTNDEDVQGSVKWVCQCSCDTDGRRLRVVTGHRLRGGGTRSCGCVVGDRNRERLTTHGKSKSIEYKTWVGLRKRCAATGGQDFIDYAARGITVCIRWSSSFESFFADMGARPKRMSIDRIDNDNGYWCGKPECEECGPLKRVPNCRWATARQQSLNRRNTVFLTIGEERLSVLEWAERAGLSRQSFLDRLRRMTPLEAITRPVHRTRGTSDSAQLPVDLLDSPMSSGEWLW